MARTNMDIVSMISEFIAPNPVQYCRLAAVNKDFYTVFASDRKWAPLDAYSVKVGIRRDYLKRVWSSEGLAEICWEKPTNETLSFEIDKVENKYIQLGYYLNSKSEIESTDDHLLGLVVDIDPSTFENMVNYDDNEEMALRACKRDLDMLHYVSDSLLETKGFLFKVLDILGSGASALRVVHPFNCIDPDMIDRELIDHAVKSCPWSVFFAEPDAIQGDEPSALVKELLPDRSSLLAAIKGVPVVLNDFPEYWNDREVYLAALSYPPRGFVPDWLPQLDQWDDVEIAIAAVMLNPHLFILLHENCRSNVGVIKQLLEGKREGRLFSINTLEGVPEPLLKNPEILGMLVDLDPVIVHESRDSVLKVLLDDFEWMKDRILCRPTNWNIASSRLKQDENLLMLALKAAKVSPEFELESIPDKFYRDRDVLKEAAELNLLHLVPDKFHPRDMIIQSVLKFGLRKYPQYTGDLGVVLAALSTDPSQIKYASPTLFVNSNFIRYVLDHRYELNSLWAEHSAREMIHDRLGSVEPNVKDMDMIQVLLSVGRDHEFLKKVPTSMIDVEFAVRLVRIDQKFFFDLPAELQNNKRVQTSIGYYGDHTSPLKCSCWVHYSSSGPGCKYRKMFK